MSRLTLLLSVIAVYSGAAFSDAPIPNTLVVANEMSGSIPHFWQNTYSFSYPQGVPSGTLNIDTPVSDYDTRGMSVSPTGDIFYFYWAVEDNGNGYLTTVDAATEDIISTVNALRIASSYHSSGLAVRFEPDGSIPSAGHPFFYHGLYTSTFAAIISQDVNGNITNPYCPSVSFPATTNRTCGVAINSDYDALYVLVSMDSGQYMVYEVTGIDSTVTSYSEWSGLFSLPGGATTIHDCGMVGNQIVFAVNNTSRVPLWSIAQGGTSATAVTTITWSEINNYTPRGVTYYGNTSTVPVSIGRLADETAVSVANLSVSENPFRSSTIISAETTGMLSIYDLSGRLVSESDFGGSYTFEPRASGVYFVQIADGETVTSARLVKL